MGLLHKSILIIIAIPNRFIMVMISMITSMMPNVIAIRFRNAISPNFHCRNPYIGTVDISAVTPADAGARFTKRPKTNAARMPGEMYPWNSERTASR